MVPPDIWGQESTHLTIEFFGGFCAAPCSGSLEISGRSVRLVMTQAEPGREEVLGSLTGRGFRLVNALDERLLGARLRWVYRNGCGAACDGFTVLLRVNAGATDLQTTFNAGPGLPPVLDDVLRLRRDLEDTLRDCKSSEVVRTAPGCEPIIA